MGHTRQASATTFPYVSLFTKGDDNAKMVPVRLFLTDVFWAISFHCRQKILQDFPREQAFRWKRVLAKLSFSVLCSSCFTHGTKHLDSCSTFHKAVVTSRAFPSHFVSLFYMQDPPEAPTPNVEWGSPVKGLLFVGGVFLDALLYYQ